MFAIAWPATAFRIPDQFSALRHRQFRIYWTGAFLSWIGNWVQSVAQGWLVYHLTGRPESLGLVGFMSGLPFLVAGPFAGIIADRFNKRRVVLLTQTIQAFLALLLAWLTFTGRVTVNDVLIIGFIGGCIWAIDNPARQAMISEIVDQEDMSNAIPLTGATFNVPRLIGPAIGGLLLERFGAGTCFLVNGLSYATMLVALLTIRNRRIKPDEEPQHFMRRMTEGLRLVATFMPFRVIILIEIVATTCAMFYITQLPAFAEGVLHAGKQGLGNLTAATGIGAIAALGMLAVLSRWGGRGRLVPLVLIGLSLSLIALGVIGVQASHLAHPGALAFPSGVCLALLGFFGVALMNGCNTLLQTNAPPTARGRVIAVHVWALSGFGPIGSLAFGYIGGRIGVPQSFVIGGVICVVAGLVALAFSRSMTVLE